MKKIFLVGLIMLVGASFAEALEDKKGYLITVCVVNSTINNNDAYYHLPATNTKLSCDEASLGEAPTIITLYQKGWRLIQAVNIDSRLTTADKKVPSSLLYFEKSK